MADTVTVTTIRDTGSELIVHLTASSDGTGETDAIKVDKSAFTVGGAEPTTLRVMAVRWASQGYSSLHLEWDRGTDVTIMRLSGNGFEDFRPDGKNDSGSGGAGEAACGAGGGACRNSRTRQRQTERRTVEQRLAHAAALVVCIHHGQPTPVGRAKTLAQ